MDNEVYSYMKIKGIEIGQVVNISYDKHNDTVVIVEDKGCRLGLVHHIFGSKAEDLEKLILALEAYHQKKYIEKEVIFDTIRRVIAGVS